jgi:hypothetical protein
MPEFLLDPIFYEHTHMPLKPKNIFTQRETLQHPDDTWLRAKLMRLELQNLNLKAQVNKKTLSGLLLGVYSKIVKNRIERQKNG